MIRLRDMGLRIIGIDPGLRATGWGVIEVAGPRLVYLASGRLTPPTKEPLPQRLASLFAGLESIFRSLSPTEAAVEETFVNRDGAATLKLGQARAVAILVPARAGLTIAEYAPNQVKKAITGTGHADKAQIRAMVRHLLPRAAPQSHDAADALAIAITHAHYRASRNWLRGESLSGGHA